MQTPPSLRLVHRVLAGLAACAFLASTASAQSSAPGSVHGRILNAANGNYLTNARVTVEGANVEVFTNSFGEYRLDGLPPGTVTLHVNYSGLSPRTATVTVSGGVTATRDFELSPVGSPETREGVPVVLNEFVVAAAREMSNSAIAINEQRYSANVKNVVSADEYGDVTEGNVGEFAKYLPGVAISYTAADARAISVRGLPPNLTPVTIDGNRMASASSSLASRTFEFEQVSINNASRIELIKSPTPDMPADSLGGTLNLISKSAFEHSRAKIDYRTYLSLNSQELTFDKSPGPSREPHLKMKPGFDLTYVKPVSKTFGFTLTALHSNQFNPQDIAIPTWVPSSMANGVIPATDPLLSRFMMVVTPKTTARTSVGANFDWKFTPRDTLSAGVQWNYYDAFFANYFQEFNTVGQLFSSAFARPVEYGPTFTHGAARAGAVGQNTIFRRKTGATTHATTKYRHHGPVWKIEGGGFYSRSTNHYRDIEGGYFDDVRLNLPSVTVNFDRVSELSVPREITTANAAGPIDWRDLGNYRLNTATTQPLDSLDVIQGAHLHATRQFDLPLVAAPLTLKAGLDVRRNDRDIRGPWRRFGFVGRDGRAGTADDLISNYDLVDDYSRVAPPYGMQQFQWVSAYKTWDLYKSHPEYWTEEITYPVLQRATNSRKITETVSAAYLRGDLKLFNRLKLVGGVRYEKTANEGYGSLSDVRATFQQDANGNLIRNSAGQPIRVSTDPAVIAGLQYKERGAYAKRDYDDYFPSLAAVFDLSDSFLVRASYARSIGRPDFSSIIPGISIADPTTSSSRIIRVNNIDLKPWKGEKLDLSLEYYFKSAGLITLGGYQKSIRDFFGIVRTAATSARLAEYGLDDEYIDYDIIYQNNVGDAKISGVEFSYRQGLGFISPWARGVQVFFNGNVQHLEGSRIADFRQFIPKTLNWGISLSRQKFTAKLNWNSRGRQRFDQLTGANVPAGTFNYFTPRLTLDLNLEYRATKHIGLFFNGRNITQVPTKIERYGPSTPGYSRLVRYEEFGVQYAVGVKGSF